MYVCMYVCVYVCTYVCLWYVCMYVCMYVCVYVRMCVCMYRMHCSAHARGMGICECIRMCIGVGGPIRYSSHYTIKCTSACIHRTHAYMLYVCICYMYVYGCMYVVCMYGICICIFMYVIYYIHRTEPAIICIHAYTYIYHTYIYI